MYSSYHNILICEEITGTIISCSRILIINSKLTLLKFFINIFQAGVSGDVYGIGVDNAVYRRIGINMMTPTGTAWKKIHDYASHITTGLNGMYMLVDGEIFHSRACEGTN